MVCNCFSDAVSQLLEQGHFLLAAQINAIVPHEGNETLDDVIYGKWVKHLLKVKIFIVNVYRREIMVHKSW